ncbi:MAG: BadF/BadG/BcrA/BcrD ATPase family protein [Pyrinomonadaceae bacterium]
MPRSAGKKKRSYQLFLGVDGGGTKTNIALMDESGEVVAEGTGGPSNPLRVGVETAVANISNAIDAACDSSGLSRGDIVAATLGLAGVRRQDIRERVRDSFMSRYRVQRLEITTDADIALYGTTLGKAGLVVIAGTGSVCLGINDNGTKFISGGWGPIAGDEGGGRGIAGEALHAVAKASDGRGEKTKLSERAAEYFRASNVENLIGAIYAPRMDNSRIAGFARLVVETAQNGDKIAVEILNDAGRELGTAAAAVLKKLNLQKRKVPIGCVGSVFKAGALLTGPMKDIIARIASKAYLTDPQMPPAHAAALMAMQSVPPAVAGD